MTHINFPTFNRHFYVIISHGGSILDHYFKKLTEFDCFLVNVSFPSVQSSHLAFHVSLAVM